MELILFFGGLVVLTVLQGGVPPRYQRLRGAEQWTDADDAQQRHLDHWGPGEETKELEDEEGEK